MFHDMGLTPQYSTTHERFEVDSANAARDFLRSHAITQAGRAFPRTCIRSWRW
jgi:hypothetical protein